MLDRAVAIGFGAAVAKRVDFYYDFVSPYAFLASTQIEGVCQRGGAELTWKPFLLGAVFKATGNSSPITVPAKAAYMTHDLQRWAGYYGLDARLPSRFPINSILALRAALAAAEHGKVVELSQAIYSAYWQRDTDIAAPDVIGKLAEGVGLDAAATLEAAGSQPVKDRLRENTDAALAAGAFGAPAMVLDGDLYWGNDRLVLLEHALSA